MTTATIGKVLVGGVPRPAANQTNTLSFRALVEKSPTIETARHVPAPAKCPQWLTAEKSPAKETARHEHAPSHSPVAARHRRSSLLTFPLPARNIVGPLWLKTVTCGLFLRHFVPPRRAGRFPRSFHSLGMTNYNGVRSVLKGLALKPSVHPYRLVIASEGVAVAWQSPGREDVVSYTIPLQPSVHPDCHVISTVVERSRGGET